MVKLLRGILQSRIAFNLRSVRDKIQVDYPCLCFLPAPLKKLRRGDVGSCKSNYVADHTRFKTSQSKQTRLHLLELTKNVSILRGDTHSL